MKFAMAKHSPVALVRVRWCRSALPSAFHALATLHGSIAGVCCGLGLPALLSLAELLFICTASGCNLVRDSLTEPSKPLVSGILEVEIKPDHLVEGLSSVDDLVCQEHINEGTNRIGDS